MTITKFLKGASLVVFVMQLHFICSQSWSPIDEYAHMDYVEKLSRGKMPAISDTLENELIKEVILVEQTKPGHIQGKSLNLGLAGYSYQAKHPPLYYLILVGPDSLLKSLHVSIIHRVQFLRVVSYLIFALGMLLLIPIGKQLRRLGYVVPEFYPLFCIFISFIFISHERYGLGNNLISVLWLNAAFYFLLKFLNQNKNSTLFLFSFFLFASLASALTNLFLFPLLLLPLLLTVRTWFNAKGLFILLAGSLLPLALLFCWYYLSQPIPEKAMFINTIIAFFIQAGTLDYFSFLRLLIQDLGTLHVFHFSIDTSMLLVSTSLLTFLFMIGVGQRIYFGAQRWLIYAYGAFLYFLVLVGFLNSSVDAVTWVAFRHYIGFLPIIITGIFGVVLMKPESLFKLFTRLIPKSFRAYLNLELRKRQMMIGNESETRINNLQEHTENLSRLLTTTANNLNSVGSNLESIHQSLQIRIEALEKQPSNDVLEVSQLLLYRNMPELVQIEEDNKRLVQEFLKERNCALEVNLSLSKYDIMFLYSLAEYKNFNTALHHYLTVGFSGYQLIRLLQQEVLPQANAALRILDFASGYGRVTRFLAAHYGAKQIWSSDIKCDAVDFQKKHLGVHGLYSSYIPEEFQPQEKFDIIFVGSLFSHLNKDLFERWLKVLLGCTAPSGYLIFSVHDMTLHPDAPQEEHVFVQSNEDLKFEFVENRITATEDYGISFVQEVYVARLIRSIDSTLSYQRYKKLFGGLQDVYVVSGNGSIIGEHLFLNKSI